MTQGDDLSPGLRVNPGTDFPLPPAELEAELMNDPAGSAPEAQKPAAAKPVERKAATLRFLGGAPIETVALDYPFAWEDREIREISVRALSVEETGAVVGAIGDENLTVFDFYAEMTGLPAEVIRALPGRDGERVTSAGYAFLPRFMKRAGGD
ncbi:hypothetical protein [Aureimonas sp. ME7]|uniref:hypothetical protein n=1 Tax=Aureimonas sp. ME7 TaxID=2744252 RepID=UPI0015F4C4EF|nr:hypothetical protein [Aureimonas sp. ME7]